MTVVRIPALRPGVASNALGVAGLVGLVVSIGGLAGWPWAVLTAAVFAIALAVIAQNAQAADGADEATRRLLHEPMRPPPAGAPNLQGASFFPAKQFAHADSTTI